MVKTKTNRRIDVMALIVFLIFIALVSRMFVLQLVQGEVFALQADNNRIRLMTITAPRGAFYDRNGTLLVTSRPGFTVSLVPISGPISDEVITRLAAILKIKPEDIKQKIAQQDNPLAPIQIKHDVGPEVITRIEERRSELEGVV
ncbi:MAG: spoVD 3, partial [Sporomusa sp.]|nr:spoVD 3 [Sporomusa sp.]